MTFFYEQEASAGGRPRQVMIGPPTAAEVNDRVR
jgi:hypothetical protein